MEIIVYFPILFCLLNVYVKVHGHNQRYEYIGRSDSNVTVIEGGTAVLPCIFYNIGDNRKVVWTDHRRTLLTVGERRIIHDKRFTLTRSSSEDWSLSISDVTYDDEGKYRCQVNTDPIKFEEVDLVVLVPAKIINLSKDTTIREGEKLVLECNVTGIPPPRVNWYKLKGEVKESMNRSGRELIIPNVKRHHADTYQCQACNDVLDECSIETTSVYVEYAPEVILRVNRISQIIGKDTILECMVQGYPISMIYWLTNNRRIIPENNYRYKTFLYESKEGNTILALSIRNLQKEDFGKYTCFASNYIGEDSESMVVSEYVTPVTTTTTKAAETTRANHQQTELSKVTDLPSEASRGNNRSVTSPVLLSLLTILITLI